MKSSFDWTIAERLYAENATDQTISDTLKCSVALVGLWRKKTGKAANCPSHIHRIPKNLLPILSEKLKAGANLDDLSLEFGIFRETIRKFAMRNSLPIAKPCVKFRPQIIGGTLDRSGYILLRVDSLSEYGYLIRANTRNDRYGYAPIHRMRMHDKLGRKLEPNEVVHHVDGDIYNNSPANLSVYESNGEHLKESLKGKVPNWTLEGFSKMCSPRKPRQQ